MSNNFGSFPARRNPARVVRIDGGVVEMEAAGGSPRKKPHGLSPRKKPRGEETFLLRLPSTAGRIPWSLRAIRRIGPKAAAPGKRPPRRRSPLPSPRRMTDLAISPRRRRSSTRTTSTMRSSTPKALPLTTKRCTSPSRLALAGTSATAAWTIGPTAAAPRIPSPGRSMISMTTTTRSSTPLATKRRVSPSWLALAGPSATAMRKIGPTAAAPRSHSSRRPAISPTMTRS